MSGFSAEWLSLSERYDRAARNTKVLDAVRRHFAGQNAIAVVDLACGTGSTVRTVGPYLPARQNWLLVDNDLSLLARTSTLSQPPDLSVTARPVDLARDLELALDGPLDLVTASALLDLVSAQSALIAGHSAPRYDCLQFFVRHLLQRSCDDALPSFFAALSKFYFRRIKAEERDVYTTVVLRLQPISPFPIRACR